MTGVAAILRYALPGIDDIQEEDDNSDDTEKESGESSDDDRSKQSGQSNFDDDQLDLLLNEGLIKNDDYDDEEDGSIDIN